MKRGTALDILNTAVEQANTHTIPEDSQQPPESPTPPETFDGLVFADTILGLEHTNAQLEARVLELEAAQALPHPVTLEEAAEVLLDQFTPAIRGFAQEVADVVLKLPRWQLVCGSLLAQYEGGCLPAPSIDPAWIEETTSHSTRKCKRCGEDFTPFKPFQDYCSNKCGTSAIQEAKDVGKVVEVVGEEALATVGGTGELSAG